MRNIGPSGVGVTGVCEPPATGLGNRTQVLSKTSMYFKYLNQLPTPFPFSYVHGRFPLLCVDADWKCSTRLMPYSSSSCAVSLDMATYFPPWPLCCPGFSVWYRALKACHWAEVGVETLPYSAPRLARLWETQEGSPCALLVHRTLHEGSYCFASMSFNLQPVSMEQWKVAVCRAENRSLFHR